MAKNVQKTAVIIGAGPAGLTAAWELLDRTDIQPILIEADTTYVGGIARTVNYKGNRMDIGGHRFFSKSDRVMNWWLHILSLRDENLEDFTINYHGKSRVVDASNSSGVLRNEMLIRKRKSRIYFNRQFFDYPIKLNLDTIKKLGFSKLVKIGFSYSSALLFPKKEEKNLEDFFINRFGRELYLTFFKSYTEKVWGIPCTEISADWGRQRIKGLNLLKSLGHFFSSLLKERDDVAQKNKETSLIEQFLYPRLGPGQLWEAVRDDVVAKGGVIQMNARCVGIQSESNKIVGIEIIAGNGERSVLKANYYFSTMPIKELIAGWQGTLPPIIKELASGLQYRDFFTIGLLVKKLSIQEAHPQAGGLIKDNWIYIQEPGVQLGRLQIFNNWSPDLVSEPGTVWLGLEYFCQEEDAIWKEKDELLAELGRKELAQIGIIEETDVMDSCVIRLPKAYPAYFGSFNEFGSIRAFVDSFENLFLIGRNGMHKYNNQDHSMLTAMTAVDNIVAGRMDKGNLWEINTEEEYLEEKVEA